MKAASNASAGATSISVDLSGAATNQPAGSITVTTNTLTVTAYSATTEATNVATSAGITDNTRLTNLKSDLSGNLSASGRANSSNAAVVSAISSLRTEIATGTSGATSKRNKRRASLKLMFANNATLKQIKMLKTDLDLPTAFKKKNVIVFKSGETINVGSIAAEDGLKDIGFYAPLSKDGDIITLTLDSKNAIITRTDSGAVEQFIVTPADNTNTITDISSDTFTAPSNVPTGYLLTDELLTINGYPLFVGSVGDGGGADSAGDPYVFPMYGKATKLPDGDAIYRLFGGDNLFINASVKQISEAKRCALKKWARARIGEVGEVLITDGYFYDKIWLTCDGNEILCDFNDKKFTLLDSEFFTITDNYGIEHKELLRGEPYRQYKIAFQSETHGEVNVFVKLYENPQIDNGIRLWTENSIVSCNGLLVRNYKPSLMTLPSLKSDYALNVDEFLTSPLKPKNEIWRTY